GNGELLLLLAGHVDDNTAVVHHDEPVAVDDGVLHVVSDHHGGEAVFLHDPVGESQNLGGGLGVQGGSVLVQQQKLGPLQRGHQKRQRLALAAGE
ncbi:hypothetical protein HHFLNI_HHFLNI_10330, partial [Dysosmobacter welbionis]